MFEILGQFIEKECSPGVIEWYGKHGHKIDVDGVSKYVRDEMTDLWYWWCFDYLEGYDKRRDALWAEVEKVDDESLISQFDKGEGFSTYNPTYKTPEAGARVRELYKQINAIDEEERTALQAHLHRLVNIREYLWT